MVRQIGRRRVLAGLAASAFMPGTARAFDAPMPRARPTRAPAELSARRLQAARRQSGEAGWLAVDLDTGAVLDAHAAGMAFAPASVAKLPSAVYALERLGPDHRFATRLSVRGALTGSVIEGDLILAGGGDPELDSDDLLPLVMALKDAGVREVRGRFIVDPGPAGEIAAIDPDQPLDASYNPAVSGLNLNFNRVRVEWPARAAASDIRVTARAERLNPDVRAVRVLTRNGPGPVFSHALEERGEVWEMSDRVLRRRGGRWLPVRRPARYAGDVFAVLAWTQGIALPPVEEGRAPEGAREIMRHEGARLPAVLDRMLHYSTNLTAELVGVAASAEAGVTGGLAGSAGAMNAWAADFAGFARGDPGFAFANHSGLSTASRVSPARMVGFLAAAAKRPRPGGAENADPRLPDGVCPLLRPYNAAVEGVDLDWSRLGIAAKTGTMDFVRGLAGYVATPGGRRIAFAVFSNDLARRSGGVERINKGWMGQARGFERALLHHWVALADTA